jgi:hypothetical protein
LRGAGLAPDWVSQGLEIDTARARRISTLAQGPVAAEGLLAEVAAPNCRIDDPNLAIPLARRQKPRLEIERAGECEVEG